MNRNARRRVADLAAKGAVWAAAIIALVPLGLVLLFTVIKGLPAIIHPEFFVNSSRPVGIPGAGIANAIAGTVVMVAIASAVALPVGVVGGISLVEY
ncbi:MAG: phosphate ABC transporter permease PtsA, partial [Candidatus Dormibacteraeota bacterium]|nr:phosphate ABC transporter permease PtsA [Candidatus Dormibacteraeota bacterium]